MHKILFCIITCLIMFNTTSGKTNQADTLRTDDVVYTYPKPDELLDVIEIENINFNRSYLNPIENENKYIDTKSKRMNLGVYIADLAYAIFFSKRNQIVKHVEVISRMSNELMISAKTRSNLKEDLIENMENLDSVYNITNTYYYEIMRELEQNKSNSSIVIISTGAYIESIYLTISLIEKYSHENELIKSIANQKNAFIDLYNNCKLYEDDVVVKEAISYLEQIVNIYMQLEVDNKGKIVMVKEPNGMVKFKSAEKVKITPEQYKLLKEVVVNIRNRITLN